jgi:amicyanin
MKLVSLIILIMAVIFLTGISSASTVHVSISNFQFQPSEVTIHKGDTVTWTNMDSVAHDVKFKDSESPNLNKGASYSQTFDDTGTFGYICDIHPYMKGKVIVN